MRLLHYPLAHTPSIAIGEAMQNLGLGFRTQSLIPQFVHVPSSPKPCVVYFSRSSSSSSPPNRNPNLRWLTSRIVELTRRKQLEQVFEEVDAAKRKYGRVNRIVMNAVMEACVRCSALDSALKMFDEMSKREGCVDRVSYGILLKGLGGAGRIDEAFHILESVEKGAAGSLKLSPGLIYGVLIKFSSSGDMRRANGLIARYRRVLREESDSVLLYNLLMKGYTNSDFPLGALTIRDEILRNGLKPDKTTYNTLISACVKSGKTDAAIQFLAEMKEEAFKANCNYLFPDAVTYTTLLKGLGDEKDLVTVQKIVVEMKLWPDLFIDRIAYTAMVDAFLACGSVGGALCIFGEMIKQAGENYSLRPKPHLFLSMMRTFAIRGDFDMVKSLHVHMWSDSVGSISASAKREADELLMEAAMNCGQIDVAKQILSNMIAKEKEFTWTSRGGMVAVRIETLSECSSSLFGPYMLPQITLDDPVEKYITAFEEAYPLPADLILKKVALRFFRDSVIPVIDDWGSCVGIVHRDDCNELDAPLSSLMRGPPPCVTTSTSIGRVLDLILEKYKMIVVVRNSDTYETTYSSSSRPVGVFRREKLFQLSIVT